ncbi:MAG: thioesterase family protein [Acidimicrobiia bacterium]|nr:thioesterase family protein [Acidimicrobiia bacterium]
MDEHQRLAQLRELFHNVEELIPFNRHLGLHAESIDHNGAVVHLDMRDELIGNFEHGVLHGGVISATLDVVGGMAAMATAVLREGSIEESLQRLRPASTIDLRVDYLRPGAGSRFTARGFTLRAGTRVAVTRMELHNEKRDLLAVGTGTYIYNYAPEEAPDQ